MSRHQYVRKLDLDAELDDYEPDDYEEEGEEMTDADRKQMAAALKQARETLGHDIPGLTDKEIEDSLWYYYFDVPKAVNYILDQYGRAQAKKKPKTKTKGQKTSKLAELAKKRKEKALAAASAKQEKASVSLLSKLSQKQAQPPPEKLEPETPPPPPLPSSPPPPPPLDIQPVQPVEASPKLEVTGVKPEVPKPTPILNSTPSETAPLPETQDKSPTAAPPSTFARSIFGERITWRHEITVTDGIFYLSGKNTPAKAGAFAEPSPDDVVLAAQSTSKGLGDPMVIMKLIPIGLNKNSNPKSPKAVTEKVEEDLKALEIEPAKKVEKIDVLKAYRESNAKENINFVVVGHVDAGKSTLMGRMLYDCGAVDERVMRKFRQESEQIGKGSFALAWVLDQTEEERTRGVTIDVATNHFETEHASFTILDAPGHRDFIPNMIAGASQADFAVLVIDASTGAFEAGFHRQGQTKEHTLLVRSIGVQRVVVAVNKLDTLDWSQSRFEEISQQMGQFLTNAGFNMKNVTFVPLSGLTGTNVAKKQEGVIPWYKGPSLLEVLESSKTLTRPVEKPLRLIISDVFRGGVQNPVSISSRIDAGYIQEGDVLVSIPSKEQATIKSITASNEPTKWAVAGSAVTVHLSGIDPIHLRPGDVLCSPQAPLIPLNSFDAKLLAFEGLTPMSVDVHKNRLHAAGKISAMLATMDKSTGQVTKKKPRHIPPGALAKVRIELAGDPIPVEAGNRIVLRNNGQTIAAGIVE